MRSRPWSLLLVPLLLGAGQPIDPKHLAWDSSGGPDIVAGYEVVQGWDGAEIGSTVTELSVPLAVRTGTAYAARVRALPVDLVATQPSPWSTLAAEWPDAIPQITSLSQLGRATAPLPGGVPVMAAPTVVRYHSGSGSGTGNLTITLTTPPAVGNLLVVQYVGAIYPATNTAAPTITENQGNTITQQAYAQAVAYYSTQSGIWTIPVTTSSGAHTVTINPTGTATETYFSVVVVEVAGQAADFLDVATSTTAANSTTVTVALGARAYAEDLVLAHMTMLDTGRTITPGGTWTQVAEIDEANNTYQCLSSIKKSYTATGTDNPTWTISTGSGQSASSAIAIKGASAAAASVVPILMRQYAAQWK